MATKTFSPEMPVAPTMMPPILSPLTKQLKFRHIICCADYDFDVEPGKQYAYRVFLLLRNPNERVPETVLLDPRQSTQRLLAVTPGKDRPDDKGKVGDLQIGPYWSNTCQTTRLPGDNRLIAGGVEPAKIPSPTEITGEVRIIRWDADSGANKWTGKAAIFRGTPLDLCL